MANTLNHYPVTYVKPVFRLIPANNAVMRTASKPKWNSLPKSVILARTRTQNLRASPVLRSQRLTLVDVVIRLYAASTDHGPRADQFVGCRYPTLVMADS